MSNKPLVVLHAATSVDSDGVPYQWFVNFPKKSSDVYQMLDIIVNRQAQTIGVYQLPNDFTEAEVESYLKKSFPYTSDDWPTQLLAAFTAASELVSADNYALKYSGHSGGLGLAYHAFAPQTPFSTFLSGLNEAIGKRLAFLDFSTVCQMASAFNYAAMAPYANYLVASDLPRTDGGCPDEFNPDNIYDSFWKTNEDTLDLETNLRGLLTAYHTLWSKWKGGDGELQSPQQLSLFQLSAATEAETTLMSDAYDEPSYFSNAKYIAIDVHPTYQSQQSQQDVWTVLKAYVEDHPSAASDEAALKATQIMRVDNREKGKWDSPLNELANGLYYS